MLVAIEMITYNHEPYIRQAIESVMAQETAFPYCLYIFEDCSTDNTAAICMELAKKYPDKIKVKLNKSNLGVIKNAKEMHSVTYNSDAKYIAMCEGDDYWTDKHKLHKQVGFLEAHEDYCLCAGLSSTLQMDGSMSPSIIKKQDISLNDILIENSLSTLTVLFRNIRSWEFFANATAKAFVGDWPLYVYLCHYTKGKCYVMPENFGVYRIHGGGAFSALGNKKATEKSFQTMAVLDELTDGKYSYLFIVSQLALYNTEHDLVECAEKLKAHIYSTGLDMALKKDLVDTLNDSEKDVSIISSLKYGNNNMAIVGCLLAIVFLNSKNSFKSFSRHTAKILRQIYKLKLHDENALVHFISVRWYAMNYFLGYSMLDLVTIGSYTSLFKYNISYMDLLFENKEKFIPLSYLYRLKTALK